MNNFIKMIKEICDEEQIKCTNLSKDWVIMLEKNNKTRFISGYKFDLNNHALGNIIDDKYALYEIFSSKKIPIIEHNIVFSPTNGNSYAKGANTYQIVYEYFQNHSQGIVLKSNNGTCGTEVFHIKKEKDIKPILDKLFFKNFSISMCPFYDIKTEYRLIVLNKECRLMYGKKRPVVIGDGKSTIKKLLIDFNPRYFNTRLEEPKYSKILKSKELYEYGWQFNLSQGSIPIEIKYSKTQKTLLKIAKDITNEIDFGFGSIDIIETKDHEFMVMELNSGVMMENYIEIRKEEYNKAKQIYRDAIKEFFK